MSLQLRFVSHSEIGPVRKNNQDSGYASPHLLVVADGMGGAAAGDLASAVAVDTIKGLDLGSPSPDACRRVRARACDRTQGTRRLKRLAGRHPTGQRADRRTHHRRLQPRRDGHHGYRGTLRRGAVESGAHRRQPGVPPPRRPPGATHPRPQLGAVPRRRRQDQRGRGGGASAPIAAPQGAQRPAGQRPGPDHRTGAGRRSGAVLQRRHLRAGRRPRDRGGPARRPTWTRRSGSSSARPWPRVASTTSPPSWPTSSRPTGAA